MVNVKYNTFAVAVLWDKINNDTLTLRVKCYNGISVRLRIHLYSYRLYHESGTPWVQLLGWVRRPHF